jgi:hypothetical protein
VKDRSVIELLVLTLTGVVAVIIIGAGAAIGIIEIRDPETDSSVPANVLINITSTILGALLGLLAGRSKFTEELTKHPQPRRRKDDVKDDEDEP